MKGTTLIVKIARYNVAKRFAKAVYTTREVNQVFSSYAEANKQYNLRNCCYEYQDEAGNIMCNCTDDEDKDAAVESILRALTAACNYKYDIVAKIGNTYFAN